MTSDQEPVGQVGCIDGRVLDVSHHAETVLLTIDGTQIRLSADAAALLARLLTAGPAEITSQSVRKEDRTADDTEVGPADQAPGSENAPDGDSDSEVEALGIFDTEESRGQRRERRSPTIYMLDGRRACVRDLLDAGLLSANEQLTWKQRKSGPMHRATVLNNGQMQLEDGTGRRFDTPSRLARTASGNVASPGWDVWCVGDGRTLADLRNELIERHSRHR